MSAGAPYSGLMFAVRMTFAHFSVSLARNFPNSAGELGGSTNPPRSTKTRFASKFSAVQSGSGVRSVSLMRQAPKNETAAATMTR
jgi:hypothetical protein